jgi:hypothetical protein
VAEWVAWAVAWVAWVAWAAAPVVAAAVEAVVAAAEAAGADDAPAFGKAPLQELVLRSLFSEHYEQIKGCLIGWVERPAALARREQNPSKPRRGGFRSIHPMYLKTDERSSIPYV